MKDKGKELSSNLIEQNILACILQSSKLIYEVEIKSDMFNHKFNKGLFNVLKYISKQKDMRDSDFDISTVVTVIDQFSDVQKQLAEEFGSKKRAIKFIDTLGERKIDASNINFFVKELNKLNAVKEIIHNNSEIKDRLVGNINKYDMDEILNMTENSVLEVSNKYTSVENKPEQIGKGMMDKYLNREVNTSDFVGCSTPYPKLNKFTRGMLREGGVVVINAKTGVGKSIVLKSIVKHVGIDLGKPIYWGANEMQKDEQRDRLLSEITGVNISVIENGLYNKAGNEHLREKIIEGIRRIENAPIYIDQIRGYDAETLVRRAKYYKSKYDIVGFVWDYVKVSKGDNRDESQLRHWLGSVVNTFKEEIADPLGIFVATATQAKTYQEMFAAESQEIENYCTTFVVLKKLSGYDKKHLDIAVGDYAFIVKTNRYGETHRYNTSKGAGSTIVKGECVLLTLNKQRLAFEEVGTF